MENITVNTDFENYVLSCIFSDEHGITCNTDKEKLQFLVNTCMIEHNCPYNTNRYGIFRSLFKSWIMGTPSTFNIAFEYIDIINIASLLDYIPANPTDEQVEVLCEKWYDMIVNSFMELCKRNEIVIPTLTK